MEEYKNMLNKTIYNFGLSMINGQTITNFENKEDILLYLYLIIIILNNEKYIEKASGLYDCNSFLEKIEFIKNESNYKIGQHNRKIVKTIRDSFVHGSGNIKFEGKYLFISNNPRPNNPVENRNTIIKISKTNLIHLLKAVSKNIANKDNFVIKKCLETIDKINNDEQFNGNEIGYICLLTLLFSYNKESLYDKYMNFYDNCLDLSSVELNNAKILEDESQRNIKSFYEDNQMVFTKVEDEILFLKDLKTLAEKGYFVERSHDGKRMIWNYNKMAKDPEINIYIPNNLLMTHLRNAVSHGFIYFENNVIKFHDFNKKLGNYFDIKMTKETLNKLLFSNYFKEGVFTNIEEHKNMMSHAYRTEISTSKNTFSEYITVYKKRFPELSEFEVIKYMYDNHKISCYLYENPNNIREFLNYILPENKCYIFSLICNFENVDNKDILLKAPNILKKDIIEGTKNFLEFLKGNDLTFLYSKLLYTKNRYSFDSENKLKKTITKEEIEELKESTRLITLYDFSSNNYFEQLLLGNYINNTNELNRILCAIIHYNEYVIGQYHTSKEDVIKDDYIDINKVYEESTEFKSGEETLKYMEQQKIATKIAMLKFKLQMNILDFFHNRISNNKFDIITNVTNKLLMRSKIDKVVASYMISLIKEGQKKKVSENNGKRK